MKLDEVVSKLESEGYSPSILEDYAGTYVHLAVSDPVGDERAGEESWREIRRLIADYHWSIQWDGDSDGFGSDATSDLCIRRR